MRKLAFWLLLCSIAVSGLSWDSSSKLSADEILRLVNWDRATFGLTELRINPTLANAANLKASDMLTRGYFAHTSPAGVTPWHWFKQAGYRFTYAGENLAMGFADAEELEQTWMSSPEHRANILSPFYDEMGMAVIQDDEAILVVQLFGSTVSRVSLRE